MFSPERQYAEETAIVLEGMGLPRAYGKLLGWLFVCDPPQQSSAELAAALELSAGTVSTGMRLLENSRYVRRVAVPGRRGKVYELAENAPVVAFQDGRVTIFRELTDKGLAMLGDESAPRARRLLRTRDFYAFMEREIPALIERFTTEYGAGE